MLLGPNKKAAQIIAGSMKKEPFQQKMGEGGEVEMQFETADVASDASMAKEQAATKLLSAVESKDAKAIVSAIQTMIDLCSVSESDED
jgi:hypothetical protein